MTADGPDVGRADARRLRNGEGQIPQLLSMADAPAYRHHFRESVNQSQAIEQLAALRAAGWIDRYTRQVTLRMLLLNANQNPTSPYYETVTISHIFESGGYVTSQCLIQAVPKEPYPGPMSVALDVVWLCSLLTIVGTEVYEVREAIQQNELSAYLHSFWNVFDWMVGLCGLTICAIWGWTIRAILLVDDYVVTPRH